MDDPFILFALVLTIFVAACVCAHVPANPNSTQSGLYSTNRVVVRLTAYWLWQHLFASPQWPSPQPMRGLDPIAKKKSMKAMSSTGMIDLRDG